MRLLRPSSSPAARSPRQRPWLVLAAALLVAAGAGAAAAFALCVRIEPELGAAAQRLVGRVFGTAAAEPAPTASGLPRLALHLASGGWQQIQADRAAALQEGFRNADDNTWVEGRAEFTGGTMDVRVRLKGVLSDHWQDADRCSLRIDVRGEGDLAGARRCSIQRPATRSFVHEWLFLAALADEGAIALHFEFVEVEIDGRARGIYALQEQTGPRLLARHGLPPAPVVGFDKGPWITYWQRQARHRALGHEPPSWFLATAPIELVRAQEHAPDSAGEAEQLRAIALLDALRSERLPAGRVFALEEMARMVAVRAALGATELDWKDLDFYYDRDTDRLRPIGKELHHAVEADTRRWWMNDAGPTFGTPLMALLLEDAAFEEAYVSQLRRVTRPEWSAALLRRHGRALARHVAALRAEFPAVAVDPQGLAAVRAVIDHALQPAQAVDVRWTPAAGGRLRLEIANLHAFSLWPTGVVLGGATVALPARRLRGRGAAARVEWANMVVPVGGTDPGAGPEALLFRLAGSPAVHRAPVSRGVRSLSAADVTLPEGALERPFWQLEPLRKELRCLPGEWRIDRPVVIPAGYRVVAGPGVCWDLSQGASVISASPLEWRGAPDAPVVLQSTDGSGGGLLLIGGAGASTLSHVVLRGLAPVQWEGGTTAAAVTLHGGRVSCSQVALSANRGGDLLHAAFGVFEFRGVECAAASGTAMVLDGAEASLWGGSVIASAAGDGVSSRGSELRVEGTLVRGAGVGVGLLVSAHGSARVADAAIGSLRVGVACGGGVHVDLQDVSLSACEVGCAVYQSDGVPPGPVTVRRLRCDAVGAETLVEDGARVSVDGVERPGDRQAVSAWVER